MQFIEMQFNGGGIMDSKMHKWVYKKKIHAMDSCKRHALHTHTHTCSHAILNICKGYTKGTNRKLEGVQGLILEHTESTANNNVQNCLTQT